MPASTRPTADPVHASEPPAIVQAGHAVLRTRARDVDARAFGSPELRGLVDTMFAVMRAAPGVGLAAPQIGVPLRVLVLEDTEALMRALGDDERKARGRVPFAPRAIV
ncbi:hypothetical protein EON77_09455, partial [bacterium]